MPAFLPIFPIDTHQRHTPMAKKAAKRAAKRPPYRLKEISDEQMSALQRALRDAIYSGPVSYTHLTLPTNREV